jgi:geranylgeranyl diphosphate synthase type II
MQLDRYLDAQRRHIDRALRRCVQPPASDPLGKAMRYGLLMGGKRLRPVLTLAACECVGGDAARALPFACAIEMVHAYSLMHDDLPAMDDDDLRRGQPTTHVVFGEAMAILAGDALLTDAFAIAIRGAAAAGVNPSATLTLVTELAEAAGSSGMVSGQVRDMEAERKRPGLRAVETTHRRKTGALLRYAVRSGAIAGRARPAAVSALTRYAEDVGLAFQIVDDLLDASATTAVTGKRVGRDAERRKTTFPEILGTSRSRQRAQALVESAVAALHRFDDRAEPLRAIARHILDRLPDPDVRSTPAQRPRGKR